MKSILDGFIGVPVASRGASMLKAHNIVAMLIESIWTAMSFPGHALQYFQLTVAILGRHAPSTRAKRHMSKIVCIWYGVVELAARVEETLWAERVEIGEVGRIAVHSPVYNIECHG